MLRKNKLERLFSEALPFFRQQGSLLRLKYLQGLNVLAYFLFFPMACTIKVLRS